jgi:ribosomal protein S19
MKKFIDKKFFIINELLVSDDSSIKTNKRDSVIFPTFVGKTVQIHNGKNFTKLVIIKEMVGHKLGEFIKTRKTFTYKKKKKKR